MVDKEVIERLDRKMQKKFIILEARTNLFSSEEYKFRIVKLDVTYDGFRKIMRLLLYVLTVLIPALIVLSRFIEVWL